MVLAVVIALSSIALGTVMGLLPGSSARAASPFRTFALVTAVAVVLGQLLPEALGAVGIAALGAFALGFVAPRVAERTAAYFRKPACSHDDAMCTDLGLEFGYVGLLLHHVGDGIGLGLFAGPLHEGHGHYDVLVALAGHTIPVTALVVLAFRTHRGTFNAVLRAVGIAITTLLGVLLANMLTPEQLATWEPWLTAFVGGLLLHIVAHGWREELAPTPMSRLMDFAALAAGIAIMSVGGHHHGHGAGHGEGHDAPDLRHAMGDALVDLSLETAPMLLFGLAVAALLQTQGSRIPESFLRGGGKLSQALRGALIGLPLPVCACGVLPVAHSLRMRGGAAAVVVAFLLATPELGVDAFALTVQFFGWPFAYLRLGAALLVAVVVALAVAYAARPQPHDLQHAHARGGDASLPFASSPARSTFSQIVGNFDELLYHVGAWTLVGLIAAAYLQATLTHGALGSIAGSGLDILVVSLLAIPTYVCASSATPLAAVLLAKGVSAGAVLSGLLLGPATNVITLVWLKQAFGTRAAAWGVAALLGTTWTLALITNQVFDLKAIQDPSAAPHSHGVFVHACAVVLVLLLARAVWRNGLRTWLGSLGETLTFEPGATAHAHGGHGHAHGSHTHGSHAHGSHAHSHEH